jgi:RNA polymerase sigma-70 factor (ECF subfamily)
VGQRQRKARVRRITPLQPDYSAASARSLSGLSGSDVVARTAWRFAPRLSAHVSFGSFRIVVRIEVPPPLMALMSHESRGRESLFKSWDEAYQRILWKVTRSFAVSPTDARELHHEMRLQLWHSTRAFAGTAKPSTWVYRVCLNTAMTWRRSLARRRDKIDAAADVNGLATEDGSPADSAGERELIDRLYASILQMAEFDRALVLLSLDGLTYREMAEITGLTENHIGVGLTRARKRLSELMKGITHELE